MYHKKNKHSKQTKNSFQKHGLKNDKTLKKSIRTIQAVLQIGSESWPRGNEKYASEKKTQQKFEKNKKRANLIE